MKQPQKEKPFLTREDIEGDKWNKRFMANMETIEDKLAYKRFLKTICQ